MGEAVAAQRYSGATLRFFFAKRADFVCTSTLLAAIRVMKANLQLSGSGRDRVRNFLLALAASSGMACFALSAAHAEADIPYYKLNYANYDTTFEAIDAKARKYAFFYWDGAAYCRYRSGWNGPGAYHVGDRRRPGQGWDGGYPWQGPGTPADHDDEPSFAAYQADYAQEFDHTAVCGVHVRQHRRVHRRAVVLRRKD